MIRRLALVAPILFGVVVSGCTEAGETTGVAAATGGVIGAGLGAIVGSQTGDAGTGLVIGAAAGAGTGALVGNAIEAQEEGIRAQDEAIERQERTIAAQKAELEELRKLNQDNPSNLKSRMRTTLNAPPTSAPSSSAPRASLGVPKDNYSAAALRERNLQIKSAPASPPKPQYDVPVVSPSSGSVPARVAVSGDCVQGEQESNKARISTESADKLFHYRRAIRLCPERADYHNALGEVYVSLGRKADATFEFKEAIALEPGNALAKQNLQSLGDGNNNRY